VRAQTIRDSRKLSLSLWERVGVRGVPQLPIVYSQRCGKRGRERATTPHFPKIGSTIGKNPLPVTFL